MCMATTICSSRRSISACPSISCDTNESAYSEQPFRDLETTNIAQFTKHFQDIELRVSHKVNLILALWIQSKETPSESCWPIRCVDVYDAKQSFTPFSIAMWFGLSNTYKAMKCFFRASFPHFNVQPIRRVERDDVYHIFAPLSST